MASFVSFFCRRWKKPRSQHSGATVVPTSQRAPYQHGLNRCVVRIFHDHSWDDFSHLGRRSTLTALTGRRKCRYPSRDCLLLPMVNLISKNRYQRDLRVSECDKLPSKVAIFKCTALSRLAMANGFFPTIMQQMSSGVC